MDRDGLTRATIGLVNGNMIIDTHTHLYDPFRDGGTPWPDPDDKVLYQTTRLDRCKGQAVPAGVDGTIVVECSPWVEDNQWVLDLAADDGFILGLVGNLDPHDHRFEEYIDRFSRNPVFRGIRARLWKADDMEGLRLLADRNLSLDVGLDEATAAIAEENPELRIIIDHCAGLPMDGGEVDRERVAQVRQAASHPNVYCKLSGMMDLRCTTRPAPTDVSHYAPVLDVLWDAFGEDRMIFGSDWPVSDYSERSYAEVLKLAQDYVDTKGGAAKGKVFCENSRAAYGWRDRTEPG